MRAHTHAHTHTHVCTHVYTHTAFHTVRQAEWNDLFLLLERMFSILDRHIVCVCELSRVRLFMTPWTGAHQAPLTMGFSRQEYWNGLPFPSPVDLSNQCFCAVYRLTQGRHLLLTQGRRLLLTQGRHRHLADFDCEGEYTTLGHNKYQPGSE